MDKNPKIKKNSDAQDQNKIYAKMSQEEIDAFRAYKHSKPSIDEAKISQAKKLYNAIYYALGTNKKESDIKLKISKIRASPEYQAAFGGGRGSTSATAWSREGDATSAKKKTDTEDTAFDLNVAYPLHADWR